MPAARISAYGIRRTASRLLTVAISFPPAAGTSVVRFVMHKLSKEEKSNIQNRSKEVDKVLARELGCQVGDEWVQISGLRTLGSDGMPICWASVFVVPEYRSIAQRLSGSTRPVYEMIAETFKESIENITVRLTAGVLSERKAKALGVEPGSPSLSVSRFYQGRGGRVFEVSISEHPASNFSYTFEFTRGWQTADHWSWNQ